MTSGQSDKTTAFVTTLVLHGVLLLFLFIFVLKTPIPPFGGGSGVVLNLGYVDEGTGQVQTYNDPNPSLINEENKPEIKPEEQQVEEKEIKPTEEGNLITSQEESDIKLEEKPAKQEENTDKKAEATKDKEKKNEDKVNPNALFGGKEGKSNNGGNNNGDKEGKIGDQGKPDGDINSKALYGNQGSGGDGNGGSGGGASLDLAGWRWEKRPKVNDEDENENGRIVFQVIIDEQGDIISIKTLEKTVSPGVEKLYRDEVEKLSFIKTDNKMPAKTSTGKITFIIRAR